VKFWDTSAIVPLILEEKVSAACRRELRSDSAMAVWALTRTEVVSALRRRERAGELTVAQTVEALRRLDGRAQRWTVVEAIQDVAARAERLLAIHPLRAADALQLGAALALFEDRPRGRTFLTGDQGLADAARREGFTVVVPA
jgi:predicted nucleic acid-binding protein